MYRILSTAAVLLSCSVLVLGQNKPNFSGTWKLNIDKSDFGPIPPPSSQTDKIEQTDTAIKDTIDTNGMQGQLNYTVTYSTDGEETSNTAGPLEIKTTGKWDGPAFNTDSKLQFQGQDVEIKSVWTLSPDGKTMTQTAHLITPMGEFDEKLVFDKQDTAAAAATTGLPPATVTGAKPNYSGTWKMDKAKSDFGVFPAPEEQTYIIDHQEPKVKVTIVQQGAQGKSENTIETTTDGKEIPTKFLGQPAMVSTTWENGNLTSTIKGNIQGQDFTVKTVYLLADGGKTLTVNSHITSGMGDMDQKVFLDKQ